MSLDNVLTRIDALKADPEEDDEWKSLLDDQKDAFQSFSYAGRAGDDGDSFSLDGFETKKLWNIMSLEEKATVKKCEPGMIGVYLNLFIGSNILLDCRDVVSSFHSHVIESTKAGNDARGMDLLEFYGTFYPIQVPRAPRRSEAAVSDSSDSSSSIVGDSLAADKIHYNMFTDQHELTFQKFKRFEIGGQHRDSTPSLEDRIKCLGLGGLQSKLMEFLPEALNNLKCTRSFLSRCPPPSETLTQTAFWVFLNHLAKRMNDCLDSSANVVIVAGMNSVDLPVKVSEKYLTLQAKKKSKKSHGGPKNTVVRIKSDMAIIEGISEKHKDLPVGEQQKEMFLDCKVESKVSEWKIVEEADEVGDDEQMEGGRSSTRLESVDKHDEVNIDCNEAHGHSAPGGSNEEYEMLPVVSFEDDNDGEEEREHWQTMFLMENHRKYGTPLPLTQAFLSLHDTREEEV